MENKDVSNVALESISKKIYTGLIEHVLSYISTHKIFWSSPFVLQIKKKFY